MLEYVCKIGDEKDIQIERYLLNSFQIPRPHLYESPCRRHLIFGCACQLFTVNEDLKNAFGSCQLLRSG